MVVLLAAVPETVDFRVIVDPDAVAVTPRPALVTVQASDDAMLALEVGP